MTKDELITRLKGYEWTDFECKKAQRDVPKDAYSTVSAFANTQGGWLPCKWPEPSSDMGQR